MRGSHKPADSPFSYVNLEEGNPTHHPLRNIKVVVGAALTSLDAEW